MKKTPGKKLALKRITVSKLATVNGALRGSYMEGCSTSCNTCQEDDACGADTAFFCYTVHWFDTDFCSIACGISF